jgi:hypothetical protein
MCVCVCVCTCVQGCARVYRHLIPPRERQLTRLRRRVRGDVVAVVRGGVPRAGDLLL